MPDDFAADQSTTGSLPITSVANSITGMIEAAADVDWFAVQLKAGLLYQFDLAAASNFVRPGTLDETLLSSTGLVVAAAATTNDKSVQYTPPTTGTYYVQVSAPNFNGFGTGAYTLTAGVLDDFTANATTTGRVTVGSTSAGSLERRNDTDWFAVTLNPNFNYRFILSPAADFTNASFSFVNLRDANGVIQSGNTLYTRDTTYTTTVGGTYYLEVGSNGGSGFGSYTLQAIGDDYAQNASTTGTLASNASKIATIEGAGDDDWFAVSLVAGATYSYSISAFAGFTSPSDLSVYLRNVTGANLAGRGSTSTALTFKPTASGTYYIDVSAGGSSTGTYQVSATTISGGSTTTTGGTTSGGTTTGGTTTGGTTTGGTSTPATTTPVYRFFDTNFGTHFYTSSSAERDTIIATRADLVSEGVGLSALTLSTNAAVSAVFRFFDSIHGTQFITSATAERDTVIATRPDLKFEGTTFYEYNTQVAGSSAVYRFFDTNYGTHFFTGSASERATILATRNDLKDEGVAFYAPAS